MCGGVILSSAASRIDSSVTTCDVEDGSSPVGSDGLRDTSIASCCEYSDGVVYERYICAVDGRFTAGSLGAATSSRRRNGGGAISWEYGACCSLWRVGDCSGNAGCLFERLPASNACGWNEPRRAAALFGSKYGELDWAVSGRSLPVLGLPVPGRAVRGRCSWNSMPRRSKALTI